MIPSFAIELLQPNLSLIDATCIAGYVVDEVPMDDVAAASTFARRVSDFSRD